MGKISSEVKAALIALLGVAVGTVLTSALSFFQWKLEEEKEARDQVREQRIELIDRTSRILASSERVKALASIHEVQSSAGNTISNICIEALVSGRTLENCDLEDMNLKLNDINKSIFSAYSEYYATKNLAVIYFCEETKQAFSNLGAGDKTWWLSTEQEQEKLIGAMFEEISCPFNQ